jgi:hypothetical protein
MHNTYQPLTYDTFLAGRYREPVDKLLVDDYRSLTDNDREHRTSAGFAIVMNDDIRFAGDTVDMAPYRWARSQAGRRTLAGLAAIDDRYHKQLRCHNLDVACSCCSR